MAREIVSVSSVRDEPEALWDLQPAESAWSGPARVADPCDPATTIITHPPVDDITMTPRWDARRGRNLRVAWPANVPELAKWKPEMSTSSLAHTRGARQHTRDSNLKKSTEARRDDRRDDRSSRVDVCETTRANVPAVKSLRNARFPTAQADEAYRRWPELLKRGQTHRRLNAFGPGVAPPGTRLTGKPDWALEGDADADADADDSDDADDDASFERGKSLSEEKTSAPRSVRVTHVVSSDGDVIARQRIERTRPFVSSRSAATNEAARRDRSVASALIARSVAGPADGRVPGARWRRAHFDAPRTVFEIGSRDTVHNEDVESTYRSNAYGVAADARRNQGSSSQARSRSKWIPGKTEKRSTSRTFRDEIEADRFRADPRGASHANGDTAKRSHFRIAASGELRGRSAADGDGRSVAPPNDLVEGTRAAARTGRGPGGGNLSSVEQRPSSSSSFVAATRTTGTVSLRSECDVTSVASCVARLGALSASFGERQRSMVNRGMREARTRIKNERSWGK